MDLGLYYFLFYSSENVLLFCVLMQCFVVILSLYREGGCVALISHDARVLWQVTSGVMMDVDWNTQTLCECKALNNVCQCLFTV